MGRKETEKLLEITMDFVKKLTNEQFDDLVKGRAIICYQRVDQGTNDDVVARFTEELQSSNGLEQITKKYRKKELISLGKHFNVQVKSRDTKRIVVEKISASLHNTRKNKESSFLKDNWIKLKNELHKMETLGQAMHFLEGRSELRTKKDILSFAKMLGVYVNEKHPKSKTMERIAESVVGARLRGEVIGKERF